MHRDIKSVVAVLTGTAGAQLIALMAMPLLTRLYTPADFGHLGVFMALVNIFAPVAALSLPMAVVLAKRQAHAKLVSVLSITLAMMVSITVFVFIALSHTSLANWLNAQMPATYLYWVPVCVFFMSLLQLTENWIIRESLFTVKAKVSVANAILINGVKVLCGFFYPSAIALITIGIITPLLNALLLFKPINTKVRFRDSKVANSKRRQYALLKRYKQFPCFQAPQLLLNALSQGVPVMIIAAYFGAISAGFYTFTRTVLAIPITLIGKALGDVIYGRIAKEINNKNAKKVTSLFLRATALLALLGTAPLVIILGWGSELFSFVFGSQWSAAGEYAKWLSIWTFFILINAPSLKVIVAYQKQAFSLVLNIISTPVRIGLLIVGAIVFMDEWIAIKLFVSASVIHNILIILVAYAICLKQEKLTPVN